MWTCVFVACMTLPVGARDNFIEVSPQELKANPKRYWSLGVIFQDRLTKVPASSPVTLGDVPYYRMETEQLGECYLDSSVYNSAKRIAPGKSYMFRGTVLNFRGSFFGRRNQFYYIIKDVAEAIGLQTDDEAVQVFVSKLEQPDKTENQILAELVQTAQEQLFAYSQQNNIPMDVLLNPRSPEYAQVTDIIDGAITQIERSQKTSSRSILNELIRVVLGSSESVMVAEEIESPQTHDQVTDRQILLKTGIGRAVAPRKIKKNSSLDLLEGIPSVK